MTLVFNASPLIVFAKAGLMDQILNLLLQTHVVTWPQNAKNLENP